MGLCLFSGSSEAYQVKLAWDASVPETEEQAEAEGYKIYYGSSPGNYDGSYSPHDVGDVTTVIIDVPIGSYIAATAYATNSEDVFLESDFSNEIQLAYGPDSATDGMLDWHWVPAPPVPDRDYEFVILPDGSTLFILKDPGDKISIGDGREPVEDPIEDPIR